MRKFLFLFLSLTLGLCLNAQNKAIFDYFEYDGKNYHETANPETHYLNPILSGFYPDPSICRVGKDYYLATSSFAYFPGVPIWHSTDLVSWEQIGHILNRPSQLNLNELRISQGIYAPDIKYNPHNNLFYMITTCVNCGGNFYVKTDDPKKDEWSDPVWTPAVGGIDPGLFFDEDGKAYIVNNDAPDHEPEYEGHRAVWIREFDWKNDCVVGEQKVIIDGGVDKSKRPIWIEAPHIYKINGKYYLMCAEGGTSLEHSEVVFVSDAPTGPYAPCKTNPILTQRDLPDDREYPITCTGHADLVQTEKGDWVAVFLGVRPYSGEHANTGRETFLLPVTWQDEQPVILPQGKEVPYTVELSSEQINLHRKNKEKSAPFCGSMNLWDDKGLFDNAFFILTPQTDFYQINSEGKLEMTPSATTLKEKKTPSFIAQRITGWTFKAETAVEFTPGSANDFAGIVCFQNYDYFVQFGKTLDETGNPILLLEVFVNGVLNEKASCLIPENRINEKVYLRVEAVTPTEYVFGYSFKNDNNSWTEIGKPVDARILSTKTAGGFTGAVVGIYATSAPGK